MAQQKKKGQGKRVPQYSGNSIALRYVCGLALLAAGGLMMISLALDMDGAVFQFMRGITRGLGGVLAPALPVVPMWAGVVLLISVQRHPPVRPWVLFTVCYLLVSAGMTLSTSTMGATGTVSMMDFMAVDNANRYINPLDYEVFLGRAFELGRDRSLGGGLMGMLLSWPLWKAMGAIGGCVVAFVLAAGDLLLLFRVDFRQIGDRMRTRQGEKQQQKAQRQAEQREREMQWQMEQEYRREQAQQQQQQQQQRQQTRPQQKRQRPQRAQQPVPAYAGSGIGFQPAEDEQYVQVSTDMVAQQEAYTNALEAQRQQRKQGKGRKQKQEQGPAPYKMAGQGTAAGAQRVSERIQRVPAPAEEPAAAADNTSSRTGYEWQNPAMQQPVAQRAQAPEPVHETTQPVRYFDQAKRPAEAETAKPEKPKSKWQQALQKKKEELHSAEAATPARSADLPPWEETPAVVVPKLQQKPHKDTWQPELHLPPRKHTEEPLEEQAPQRKPYVFPPLSLLKEPVPYNDTTYQEDEERSRQLENALAKLKVPAKVMHVTHGPTLSRFEIMVGEDITVERVMGLRRTLASRMSTSSVRVEAIPETPLIGIEIPNRQRQMVTLREVLDSPEMRANHMPLAVALGCDIAGAPIICELNKMPHMLVAGMTGGGKSVCVHSILHSILYRTTPDEVRLILFDPKMNEMVHYEGLPHLLLPVVTSPQKVAAVLDWAVAEMMRRYQLLRDNRVPKIDEYNARLPAGEKRLPFIVIVIDEMTDLMMTCGKEVEASVQRLAQLARAAGIHLLLATQNPVREIITGKIKANIPARIAFKTAEQVDSRTILNSVGAESLLGRGDMIFKSDTGSIRAQGCFLSTEEMEAITNFIRINNEPEYDCDLMDMLEHADHDGTPSVSIPSMDNQQGNGTDDATMLRRAIEIAVEDGQISTTGLQRQLKLGFGRAGRITDEMEKRGIISAKDGAKPRRCLISREEYEMLKETLPKDGEPLD